MKRPLQLTLALLVLAAVLLNGCSLNAERDPMHGTWQWDRSVGGLAGWTLTPASEGYTQRLQLGPGHHFAFFRNDSLAAQGTFSVRSDGNAPVIRYETPSTWWFFAAGQYVDRNGPDTLFLHDRCADCFTHTFVRE